MYRYVHVCVRVCDILGCHGSKILLQTRLDGLKFNYPLPGLGKLVS